MLFDHEKLREISEKFLKHDIENGEREIHDNILEMIKSEVLYLGLLRNGSYGNAIILIDEKKAKEWNDSKKKELIGE